MSNYLTGLRGDSPRAGKFDDFFVHPEVRENVEDDDLARVIGNDESFDLFTSIRHRAIVIGQPGSGKSTWAKWLQREALSTRWNGICVRIELRRFSNESLLSLHDVIREVAGQHLAEELTVDRIGEWLRTKKVVFILDGFDEIRPSDRDSIYDWIVELSTVVQNCPFVLTSRPITTDHLERLSLSWDTWNIEPFDEDRIVDYIQRWYSYMPLLAEGNEEIDPLKLAESWLGDPTIEPLTGNPLLLSTLLMVHHLDGSLPSGRAQLYRRYVEGMLGLWDDRRKVTATSIELSLEEKRQIMKRFALQMFLQQKEQLDENAALELMKRLLQRLNIPLAEEDVLAGLRERTGLIIGPGIYSFSHKSVLEYLVAESVHQGDQRDESGHRIDRFCLFEHRDDDRWNTVTFLWAGLAPLTDVESFIDECISARTWDLAYGILYDQYDRFPAEICRSLLLKLIYADQSSVNYDRNTYWGHPYKADVDPGFEIPTFKLRSLTSSHTGLHWLLNRAVQVSVITWVDGNGLTGGIRDLLWMYCAIFSENVEEWKACLTAPCPDSGTRKEWLYWAVQSVFRMTVTRKDLTYLENTITAYKTACPHFRGLIPIALISVGFYLFEDKFDFKDEKFIDGYTNILKVLPESGDGEIMQDLLLGTYEWADGFDSIEDLLVAFIEQLEKLAEEGLLKKDLVYGRAINFVKELRNYRDSLQTN